MTFPPIVGALMEAGFDGYLVDLRVDRATYDLREGEGFSLPTHDTAVAMGAGFDTGAVQAANREAQSRAPGYTYRGFCEKVKRAGCTGYLVSDAADDDGCSTSGAPAGRTGWLAGLVGLAIAAARRSRRG